MITYTVITQELATIAPFIAAIGAVISAIKSNMSYRKLKYETSPNHGSSIHDKINMIVSRLENDEKTTIQYREALDKRLCHIESKLQHKNAICKRNKRK